MEAVERDLYDRRFLVARPLLRAIETSPSVLLVDEIDRADDEFEAFLLEVLGDFTISVPELGTIRAATAPLVVLTSNRTREVHDALKRRCLYHWLEHPSYEREVAIIRRRLPEAGEQLAGDVARATAMLREQDLLKPPGVAESLDWTEALLALGARSLDPDRAARTLGAVLKYREDTGAGTCRSGSRCWSRDRRGRTPRTRQPGRVRPDAARGRGRRWSRPGAGDGARAGGRTSRSTPAAAATSTGPAGSRSCSGPDDLPRYDRAFAAWFGGEEPARPALGPAGPARRARRRRCPPRAASPSRETGPDPAGRDGEPAGGAAAPRRGPAHRPRAGRAAPDAGHARRHLPRCGSRAPAAAVPSRSDLDPHRTVRAMLERGGEPAAAAPAGQHGAAAARGAAARRERVDGALRGHPAALRARLRPQPAAHRGLHPRHPADPGLP